MTGERPAVEWVRPWGPLAVAAGTAALVLAALGTWVLVGALPGLVADVLFVLALVVLLRHRASFTDPEDCTGAGVSVLGFAWATRWRAGSSCRCSARRGRGARRCPGGCTCWSGSGSWR